MLSNQRYGTYNFPDPKQYRDPVEYQAEPKSAEEIVEDMKKGEVSEDPFNSNDISVSFYKQKAAEMEEDMKLGLYDHIGKPVRVHQDAIICGKYHLGQLLGEGGFGAVFLSKEDLDIVIKTEFALRTEDQFKNEVELQNKAASKGFSCPIDAHRCEMLDRKIYGKEPQKQ